MATYRCPMCGAEMVEPQLFAIMEKLTPNKEILKARLTLLIKAQAEPSEAYLEMIQAQKKLIQANLREQKELSDAYMADCMAFEVYKEESGDLRDEEKRLRDRLAELELKLLAKEKEKGYQKYVQEVLNRFTEAKEELSYSKKRGRAGHLQRDLGQKTGR